MKIFGSKDTPCGKCGGTNKSLQKHSASSQFWRCKDCRNATDRKRWARDPKYAEYHAEYRKTYKKPNEKHYTKLYRCRKANAVPHDADLKAIKEIYKNCPEGHHVDHIIPLSRGGSHHEDNLQYLTAEENLKKGSKLPTEYDGV